MKRIYRFILGRRPTFYLSLLFLGLIMVVWLSVNRRNLKECLKSYQERNRQRDRVSALQKRIKDLTREKSILENSVEANEIAVRNRFYMARPGEHVVIVENAESGKATENSTGQKQP